MLLRLLRDLMGDRRPPVELDVLRHASELRNRSLHDDAIEMLTTLLECKPDCLPALMLRGVAKRETGRLEEAMTDFAGADGLDPNNEQCLLELAGGWYALGNRRLALEYCERGRRADPASTRLFALLAQIKLGGEFYFQILARILDYVKPRTYVEIGVFQGDSLRLAKAPTLAIGIDPQPQLTAPLAANHRVFSETSDAFFAGHDLRAEFGGLPVDMAFIDGMHNFEFALRDFANIERHCTRNSIILIHDSYPLDRESAGRAPRMVNWSGDIWRLIVLLKKYRPDLSISTVGTPPTGLSVVRNLDPDSRVLFEQHDRLCEEFLALDYSYLDDDMPGKLNLFPNEWGRISVDILAEAASRHGSGVGPACDRAREDKRHNPLIEYLENNRDGRLVHRWRHYFDIYHRHLAQFRGQQLTMIEIGVFNGGSLRMWRDYFGPQARIVGVDINPECKQFSEPGIDIVIGDQADRAFLRSLSDRYPDFAILVDDGGHRMHQQIATFEELYPRLRSDGVYLCEDTHTSYLPMLGGGYRQPQTFIETVKPLIDRLNAFHSPDRSQLAPDDFTRTTDSMHFYDSVLVIEKKAREPPEQVTYGSIGDVPYIAPSHSGRLLRRGSF